MARYEGDGSYLKLIAENYGKTLAGTFETIEANNGIKYIPLSFLCAGYNHYISGTASGKSSSGIYWESRIRSLIASNYFGFDSVIFGLQENNRKGLGVSLRCVAKPSPLLILFVPKGGRWQDLMEMEAIISS